MDTFSLRAWQYEFELVKVTPDAWRQELAATPVDFLFVESAWQGNGGAWAYHLTGPTAPRPALVELLAFCRQNGIPSVFWNKEDPPHFEDFLDTARLFDWVFTTDSNLLDTYRQRLGHDRVGVLPFAAQPAIHNPIRPSRGFHERDVAFAGTYFRDKFPARREQLDLVLGGALDASPRLEHGLEIFSRFQGGEQKYQFPPEFQSRVVGSLPYEKMLTAYKAYQVFLNVNTVVDSPSMCARRIFEITACGTPVLTTPSAAIRSFFTEKECLVAEDRRDAELKIRALINSPQWADEIVHRAQRTIWEKHTYSHRALTVLEGIDLDNRKVTAGWESLQPPVSAVCVSRRPQQLDHVLGMVARQRYPRLELVFIANGPDFDSGNVETRAAQLGIEHVVFSEQPEEVALGACLNLGVELASGQVIAKMDDDDVYGPYYLTDSVHALNYSGAEVVGKKAHYVQLRELGVIVLENPEMEHQFTELVAGPTILARRNVFEQVRFPELNIGEDSTFLRAVTAAGGVIYSSDRFQFLKVRRGSSGGHTWEADDYAVLAAGTVATVPADPLMKKAWFEC